MYQGHKNRTHWNVAWYLFNEYQLYQLMLCCCADANQLGEGLDGAAARILNDLKSMGIDKTPDGYKYSRTAIRAALTHWEG